MANWRGTLVFVHRKGISTHEVFEEGAVEKLLHHYEYDDFQYMSFVEFMHPFSLIREKQQ